MKQNKNVLITGGGGLIGTAARRAFAAAGWHAVALDLRAHDLAGRRVEHIGDLTTEPRLEAMLAEVSGVVHLAAVSRVCDAERQPERCSQVNLHGTARLLTAAANAGCRWLIFGSSREVYGEPTSLPVRESTTLQPINHYGRVKVAGERLVAEQCAAHGMAHSVLRFSNVYGHPHDHHSRLTNAFIRRALAGAALEIHGGGQVFDFTYCNDTAAAIVAAAEYLHTNHVSPPPMHVLTGQPTAIDELARMVLAITNSNAEVVVTAGREYDVHQFYGHPGLLQQTLNFTCQTNLRAGLAQTIQDYRQAAAQPSRPSRLPRPQHAARQPESYA